MNTNFLVQDGITRCDWAHSHPLLASYHDREWGTPLYDDDRLFEMFSLDCFQAGLSWLTILKKRDAFLQAFKRFNIRQVAGFTGDDVLSLMHNPGIVRNRLKIPAIIENAKITLDIQKEFDTFSSYIWQFSEGKIVYNQWKIQREIPATSAISDAMSRDMKKRGFRFAGSTICYAFMQSIGMVNDHIQTCFRHHME